MNGRASIYYASGRSAAKSGRWAPLDEADHQSAEVRESQQAMSMARAVAPPFVGGELRAWDALGHLLRNVGGIDSVVLAADEYGRGRDLAQAVAQIKAVLRQEHGSLSALQT